MFGAGGDHRHHRVGHVVRFAAHLAQSGFPQTIGQSPHRRQADPGQQARGRMGEGEGRLQQDRGGARVTDQPSATLQLGGVVAAPRARIESRPSSHQKVKPQARKRPGELSETGRGVAVSAEIPWVPAVVTCALRPHTVPAAHRCGQSWPQRQRAALPAIGTPQPLGCDLCLEIDLVVPSQQQNMTADVREFGPKGGLSLFPGSSSVAALTGHQQERLRQLPDFLLQFEQEPRRVAMDVKCLRVGERDCLHPFGQFFKLHENTVVPVPAPDGVPSTTFVDETSRPCWESDAPRRTQRPS